MRLRALVPVAVLAVLAVFAPLARAGEPAPLPAFIRETYTKHEQLVPKDAGPAKRYPILMIRTPYSVGPYGIDATPDSLGPSEAAAWEKFIFALQDVRGRNLSEGTFVDVRPFLEMKGLKEFDESSDAFDTVDWFVKNVTHNNGKVGAWGISYPGFYAAMAAFDAGPPKEARPVAYQLGAEGRLSTETPAGGTAAVAEWVSDPTKPVPYLESIDIGTDADWVV